MKATDPEKMNARAKRGETPPGFEQKFETYAQEDLISLLQHKNAQTRTAAATLLGRKRCVSAIPVLCKQLSEETALYSRLAQSEALSAIGLPALSDLMNIICKIGHNQHYTLPKDLFKKWNYPLPRDIVARTIVKIGPAALPTLIENLGESLDPFVTAECIDAVGYISYYSGEQQAFETLIMLCKKYHNHPVIQWKLIRAFQAFPRTDTVEYLKEVLMTSHVPQHRWEAARSLGQIGTTQAENCLKSAKKEEHRLVKEMIQRSLEHIEKHDK